MAAFAAAILLSGPLHGALASFFPTIPFAKVFRYLLLALLLGVLVGTRVREADVEAPMGRGREVAIAPAWRGKGRGLPAPLIRGAETCSNAGVRGLRPSGHSAVADWVTMGNGGTPNAPSAGARRQSRGVSCSTRVWYLP